MLLYLIQNQQSKSVLIGSAHGDIFRQFLNVLEANSEPLSLLRVLEFHDDHRIFDLLALHCKAHHIRNNWYTEKALTIIHSFLWCPAYHQYHDVTTAFYPVFEFEAQDEARESLKAQIE